MAKTEHYHTRFEPDRTYHVYNRSIDKKPLFTQERNYNFFLGRIEKYLSPVLDVYAWCLMNNHFHLMVRIKDLSTFEKLSNQAALNTAKQNLSTSEKLTNSVASDVHQITSHAFQKMFQSYAMAFNIQENRTGTLFQTPFKRSLIDNDSYFTQLIYYIHANPQLHGFVDDFRDYRWSSYHQFLMREEDLAIRLGGLSNLKMLEWFGGKDEYIKYHSSLQKNIEPKIAFDDD